jgi:hypothetical protein
MGHLILHVATGLYPGDVQSLIGGHAENTLPLSKPLRQVLFNAIGPDFFLLFAPNISVA